VLGDPPPKDFLWAPGAQGLGVSPGHLTLPPGGTGALTISSGGDAVQWRASGDGPVRLSPGGGALGPGVAQIIGVHAPADGPGSEVITFWPGGKQVRVAWDGRPSSPPSSPHPPPTPTPTPTTPSPTEPPPSTPAPAPPQHSDPPKPSAPSSSGPDA
jgi:hypothetical protein